MTVFKKLKENLDMRMYIEVCDGEKAFFIEVLKDGFYPVFAALNKDEVKELITQLKIVLVKLDENSK